MTWRRWTPKEDAVLLSNPLKVCRTLLPHRTRGAIYCRRLFLGVKRK